MSNIKLEIARGCYFVDSDNEDSATVIPSKGCNKLDSYDWLSDIDTLNRTDIFEVRFKNTRKGFYQNANDLALKVGDIVAVEATPGHDIGIISATNDMVNKQMRKTGFRANGVEFRKIYRKAKPTDVVKWQRAVAMEHQTMISSRQIASSLNLNMKIGDVEYQGDGAKAIFYYIADERVDFRELIKIFAEQFRIRIEMKQIGARQEAGRIGGIGACGRELCCSKWVSNFVSVTTSSARFQEISLNPQKLAGQCGKLKCCLNYEVDAYIDCKKRLPRIQQPLETTDAQYFLVKTDILRGLMSFSSDPHSMANIITLPVERVREIIKLNRRGVKADQLVSEKEVQPEVEPNFMNATGEDSITRFDSSKKNGNGGGRNDRSRGRNRQRGDRPRSEAKPNDPNNAPQETVREMRTEKSNTTTTAPKEERGEKPNDNRNRRGRSSQRRRFQKGKENNNQ